MTAKPSYEALERRVQELEKIESEQKYSKEALRKTETLFQLLYEKAPLGYQSLDENGHFIIVNKTWLDALGYAKEDVIGKSFADFLHPDWRDHFLENFPRFKSIGEILGVEFEMVKKNGELILVSFTGKISRDQKGNFQQTHCIFHDITERKRAEELSHESEQRFRVMADGTPVMIWVHDAKGNIEFINTAYSVFFGVNLEQVLGQNWQPLVHPDNRKSYVDAFMQALKDQKPFHAEARVRDVNGEWRWIESFGSPRFSADGKFCGIVGSSPDITDRKQAEENLHKLNRKLEQKVAERTQLAKDRANKLQALVGELALAEQKERQRIARLLHDNLQQMLIGARINSEILSRNVGGKHKKIAKNVFDLINQSIKTSRSLTAELYPPVLQQGLLAALKWTVRWMNENYGLTIDLHTDADIDPEQEDITAFLYQSIRELLLNVIKHSGAKSARLEMTRDEGENRLRVTVSDKGSGFDPGVVLKNEGSGFGLFSIHERLQLLGGSIRIESSPGNGSSLSLIIPLESKQEKEDEVILEIKTENKITKTGKDKIRTLVVDDHTVVRQGISALLSFHPDIEMVGEASDGQEAVEKARQLHPDVILMDINMPGMDGIQATRIIRSEHPCVRIIGLSMHDKQDLADQMIQAGASAYCTKDGSTDELLSAIRRSD